MESLSDLHEQITKLKRTGHLMMWGGWSAVTVACFLQWGIVAAAIAIGIPVGCFGFGVALSAIHSENEIKRLGL